MDSGMKRLPLTILLVTVLAISALAGCTSKEEEWERMKQASVAEVGQPAPDFALNDIYGKEHRLSEYISNGRIVVLEWFNPDCVYTRKHHVANRTMREISDWIMDKKVAILAVNSSAPGTRGHGIDRNKQAKIDFGIRYPILIDEAGEVGKRYKAKTTPHMYIIAEDGVLIYSGALDNDKSEDQPGKINFVRVALEQRLGNRTISVKKTKPHGCRIQYGVPLDKN